MDCCLAAKILKYNKAMVLNNCVWVGIMISSVTSISRHQCDARKPIYRAGNKKHVAASKATSKVLPSLGSEPRKVVIASSRRAMHKKEAGTATIAPRSTTEAVENINMLFEPLVENPTDVAPNGYMLCLVPEPKDRVDAMDNITKNQPNDDRRRGDAVIVNLRWKN